MDDYKLIFLYRHGETDMNVKDITMGQLENIDTNFTKNGFKQIKEIAENIEENNIEIIYTSDYKRALETAEIVVSNVKKGIPIGINKEFRGINMGKFQGMLYNDFIINSDVQKCFMDHDIPFINGESINELNNRLVTGIINICRNNNKRIAIISHSAAISNLRSYLMNDSYISLRMCCLLYNKEKLNVIGYVPSKVIDNKLIVLDNNEYK